MNRRKLVANTITLVPSVALFRGQAVVASPSTALDEYPSGDLAALHASRNTEQVVMEMLQLCLERIGWQGDVSDWQNNLDQALDRVQSWLSSKTDQLPMLITGFQMDCLRKLYHAASAGNEAETLFSAFALCDAFIPFNHWIEEGFLTGKHDKLTELAHRRPEIHALLGSATRRIPLQELERHLEVWELRGRNAFAIANNKSAGHHDFRPKYRAHLLREWVCLALHTSSSTQISQ